jgi:preprotein translocase subunit SecD
MKAELKQRALILGGVVLFAFLLLVPTIFRSIGGSWPLSKPLSLGLDLSGGVHLVYEVQVDEAVNGKLRAMANGLRRTLRDEKIAVVSATVTDAGVLQLVVLNERLAQQAKEKVGEDYPELEFVSSETQGTKSVLSFALPEQRKEEVRAQAVTQALETIRNRVDQFGVAEPLLQRVGQKRIMLQMPGVTDIEKVKRLVGRVARLEFRLIPEGRSPSGTDTLKDLSGAQVQVEQNVLMTGEVVDNATISVGAGQVEVLLRFTSEGGRLFRQITSENVGRRLAIVLDGVVYSDPVVREAIGGGQASISGAFSVEEAQQLSVVLKAGALPAPLDIAEERTVGPSLGKESIQRGVAAICIGLVLVAIFMIMYYGKSGVVAVASLVLNVILILACLSFFGATLTLPGLAGLALTVGMAVDSNVIIFERIREELLNGATRDAAVQGGFDKASNAIIDANVTGIISGIILYYFGTGPIRGFAVTTTVGMVTTLFCAVFAARFAFEYFALKGGKKGLSI